MLMAVAYYLVHRLGNKVLLQRLWFPRAIIILFQMTLMGTVSAACRVLVDASINGATWHVVVALVATGEVGLYFASQLWFFFWRRHSPTAAYTEKLKVLACCATIPIGCSFSPPP